MTTTHRVAAVEVALIAPAALFMAALLLRAIPPANDPVNPFQHFVLWYAAHPWTLWTLLLGLPMLVAASGAAVLLQSWTEFRAALAHWPILLVAATTVTAAGTFGFVVLHMLAN